MYLVVAIIIIINLFHKQHQYHWPNIVDDVKVAADILDDPLKILTEHKCVTNVVVVDRSRKLDEAAVTETLDKFSPPSTSTDWWRYAKCGVWTWGLVGPSGTPQHVLQTAPFVINGLVTKVSWVLCNIDGQVWGAFVYEHYQLSPCDVEHSITNIILIFFYS